MLGGNNLFKKETPKIILGGIAIIIAFNLLAINNFFIPNNELKLGKASSKTIKSPRTVYYKSKIKTTEAQERAKLKAEKVYRFDSMVFGQQEFRVNEIFKRFEEIRSDSSINKGELLSNTLNAKLSIGTTDYILQINDIIWQNFKNNISQIISDIQKNEKIKNDELLSNNILDKKISTETSAIERSAARELIPALILPNYLYSKDETVNQEKVLIEEVEPVTLLVVKDEVIIPAGQIINELSLEKLEAVGLKQVDFFNYKTLGTVILASLLSIFSILYFSFLFKNKNTSVSSAKALLIFAIFFILAVLSFQALTSLKPIMNYMIPIAAASMLISVLINIEAAIFSAMIFAMFLGIILSNSLELTTLYLITSLVGIYKIKRINRLEDIFKAGFYLVIFSFLISMAFHFIAGSFSVRTLSVLLGASSIYGLSAVVIIIGTLLSWGRIFKVTTMLELLELENPNNKLIKELSLKAPGTYHHSVFVSNLAEKAAKDLHANVLLVRVGALYHDIGKTLNPSYYIENQKRYNIHKIIEDPEKSAELIKDHVQNGIDLAKKSKLPQEITHFIESHHGTSNVFYFLAKAKEEGQKIDLSKFSYSGPLPQTKEAAILMLADSIEAKAKATENLTSDNIKEFVYEIVEFKLKSDQLRESDLTLKELDALKKSFIETLKAMYHKRIEYGK